MYKIESQYLNQTVTIHYWSCGKKKLDFKGSLEDCLKSKEIKYKPNRNGFSFEFSFGRLTVSLVNSSFDDGAFIALKLYLTYQGDKAQIEFDYRNQRLNWRV